MKKQGFKTPDGYAQRVGSSRVITLGLHGLELEKIVGNFPLFTVSITVCFLHMITFSEPQIKTHNLAKEFSAAFK